MFEVKDGVPYPGKVTLYAAAPGDLQARKLVVSRKEFIDGCNAFANALAGERESSPSETTKTA